MHGFIKLHRQLIEWEWYSDMKVKTVFLHLLLTANFKDNNWQGKTIKRGQVVIGLSKFGAQIGLSVQEVRTCLKKLKSTKEIAIRATSKYTLVTIVKFDVYQDIENRSNKQITNTATNEQQTNNKPTTNEQQQRKNYKNSKNEKNEKNNTLKPSLNIEDKIHSKSSPTKKFIPPTIEDLENYCIERGWKTSFAEVFLDGNIQSGWKLSNGKAMEDWKAACRVWMSKDYNNKYLDNKARAINPVNEDKTKLITDRLPNQQKESYLKKVAMALKRSLDNPDITPKQKAEYVYMSAADFVERFNADHPKLYESCLNEYHERIIKSLSM